MSIWSELASTERLVSEADSEFNLTQSLSKGYGERRINATTSFVAEPRSSIRERALQKALASVRDPDFLSAPERERDRSLSPVERDVLSQRLAQRIGAERRLMQQMVQVREQDAAADAQERAYAKASPLTQSRMRDGWYRRSVLDRNAAIAGMLRRERRQTAPLTREALGRAKAIAAARGISDPYVVVASDVKVKDRDLIDPCVEYRLIQARRRETLFAKGYMFRGYPGPRERKSPC